MALATATITADLADQLGNDFDARRTKVWISTNIPGDTIVDKAGNKVRLGTGTVTLGADGAASFTVWTPGADANPASWQTYIHVDYPDKARQTRESRTFGPFTITASTDLADLIEEQEVPPVYLSTVTQQLDTKVAEAQAAAALAQDISNIDTSDDAIDAALQLPGSKSAARLFASFARAGYEIQVPDNVPGDGTDASSAIQAVVDAAAAYGVSRLRFPRNKTYGITSPIRLKSGVHLDFNGSIVKAISSATKACMVASQGLVPADGSGGDGATYIEDASVSNALFDNQGGTTENTGKSYAVFYVQRAKRVRVEHCKFINVGTRQAIRFAELTDSCVAAYNHITMPVDNPYATLTNAQGISLFSATVDPYAGGLTDAMTFTEPTDVSQRHLIIGNTILNGTHGVALAGAQRCVVTDNFIDGPSHRGIIMSPVASRNVISDNTINDFGSAAILMAYGSHRNVVKGNNCRTTNSVGERDGIRCSFGAHGNLIANNYVEGVTNRGLVCFTAAVRNHFVGNKVVDCVIGAALISLNTDTGYFQPANSPNMEFNALHDNSFYACGTGILLKQANTTSAATTAGLQILLRRVSVVGNHVYTCTTGISLAADDSGAISEIVLNTNVVQNCTTPFSSTGTGGSARGTFSLSGAVGNIGFLAANKTAYSPGAIAAGASVGTTVTVTGARGGDQVSVSYSAGLAAGLNMFASVTGNDTVTVTIMNTTAGALTPAANATLRVAVSKV